MIRAFIFDLDGTLVGTEPLRALSHARAALELRPNSFTEADVVEACKEWVGISTQETLLALIDRFGLEEVARKRMDEFDVKEPWEVFLALDLRHYEKMLADLPTLRRAQVGPTVALLHEVRSAGYKTGLASMTTHDLVFDIVQSLDLLKEFDVVATCEDVQRGKPAPDIFLLVAHRLAVSPSECLVIEDSLPGVQAALAVGMRCIAVPTAFSRPLFAGQDVLNPQWIVDDPTKLEPAVERLLAEQGVVGLPQMRTGARI